MLRIVRSIIHRTDSAAPALHNNNGFSSDVPVTNDQPRAPTCIRSSSSKQRITISSHGIGNALSFIPNVNLFQNPAATR